MEEKVTARVCPSNPSLWRGKGSGSCSDTCALLSPCPSRWTPPCWAASACWTRRPSCAVLRPTRCPPCSRRPPAPTMPSGWPGSSGPPTATSSSWPTTARSTASWSRACVCVPVLPGLQAQSPVLPQCPPPPGSWGAQPGLCPSAWSPGADSCSCHLLTEACTHRSAGSGRPVPRSFLTAAEGGAASSPVASVHQKPGNQ